MLKSGAQYLGGLNDGRMVYLGSEKVGDVASHPAFAPVARTMAGMFDLKLRLQGGAETGLLGTDHSAYFDIAWSPAGLKRRTEIHRTLAASTWGLIGRPPDYVASFVTGMAAQPDIFGQFAAHLSAYHQYAAQNDLFLAHAVVPPSGSRSFGPEKSQEHESKGCKVTRETDGGVYVSGIKILATSAAIADELWVGNVIQLAPDKQQEAITFAIPCATEGLSLWARRPLRNGASIGEFDLVTRYDESDAVAVFKDVFVPWERVFVHRDVALSRQIYIGTPSHVYANHQSCVRFAAKLRMLAGLTERIMDMTGAGTAAAGQELLGELASAEAAIDAMIFAQLTVPESWPSGALGYNRRFVYAAMNWCRDIHPRIVEILRGAIGSNPLQIPAGRLEDLGPDMRDVFEDAWSGRFCSAHRRVQLYALAWDLVGSEFAGRQSLYEEFFAGGSTVLRGHSYREAPWVEFSRDVECLLNQIAAARD